MYFAGEFAEDEGDFAGVCGAHEELGGFWVVSGVEEIGSVKGRLA